MRYNTELHTPESLQEQLDTIRYLNPDVRVTGSLGRSVLFGQFVHNPDYEYHLRSQNALYDHTGHARDIDVVGVSHIANTGSYKVDNIAFDNTSVSVWKEGTDWWLRSIDKNFAEQLHPDVMAPVEGTGASNLTGVTVPLQTHIALTLSMGVTRKQDDLAVRLLQEVGQTLPYHLPDSLYKPFRDLSVMLRETPTSIHSHVYRRFFPAKAKRVLDPLLKSAGIIASTGLHEVS